MAGPYAALCCGVSWAKWSSGPSLTLKIPSFSISGVWRRWSAWQTKVCKNVIRGWSLVCISSTLDYFYCRSFKVWSSAEKSLWRRGNNFRNILWRAPDFSPWGVILSVLAVAGDDKADCDFRERPSGSSSSHVQRCIIFSNIQCLVSRLELAAPDSGLNVLYLAEYGLRDRLEFVGLHRVLTRKRVETKSIVADVHQMVEQIPTGEGYRSLLTAKVWVDKSRVALLHYLHSWTGGCWSGPRWRIRCWGTGKSLKTHVAVGEDGWLWARHELANCEKRCASSGTLSKGWVGPSVVNECPVLSFKRQNWYMFVQAILQEFLKV